MAHPIQPAAVAVPAPPPPAGAIREAPRTYRELYADAANNPAPDRTAGYLAGYRFAGEGVIPVPIQLRDQTVAMSDRQPMAFLCMINGLDGLPEVSIVHRLLRFMDMPGDEPTGFHDKVLGLLGDILPHQYPAVETPASMFHLVNTPVRVPTVAAMEALLPAWVDPRTPLGPFTELDPETEVVRPRNTQLLPGRYAALIVHRRRITAKQAYQEIVGAIRADDALESCNDVVVWLRAACTARGGGGAQNALPSVHHPLVPLHMPPEVYQYVTQKVQTDLPALTATEGVGNTGTTATLIGALRALTQQREGGDDQQDRGRPARETKSIVDAYKETHRVLLRFCNVASPDDVAPIWQRLSNCHKSEQHTLLTQEMQKVCMARGLSTELYVPVVTTALKQMIVGFQFPGHSADDLSTGCQPFLVAYAGKAHHLQVTNSSAVANQLVQGEQNASLADIRTIREGEKIKFPQDITEVCVTLFRYAVLCQCLFQGVGPTHPYVEALWSTAVGLQNIAPFVTDRYRELAQVQNITRTYHARIVRAVQVNAHEYLQQISTNVVDSVIGVEVPNFAPMLQELRRGTFHQSTNWMDLPVEYLESAPQSGPTAAMTTGQASSMGSGASPSGATVGGQSNRTGVSSLSGDTARTAVARVSNPISDNDFTAITLRAGGTRTILREHRPPTNDSGHEFCVAWWTKGGCFPNCGRRATHQPFATPGERTRLLTFVREHLAAPNATGTHA